VTNSVSKIEGHSDVMPCLLLNLLFLGAIRGV